MTRKNPTPLLYATPTEKGPEAPFVTVVVLEMVVVKVVVEVPEPWVDNR